MDRRRFGQRVRLQAALEREGERFARLAGGAGSHYEQAFRLLQSPATQRAFRLAAESDRIRQRCRLDRYGVRVLSACGSFGNSEVV